MAKPAFSLPKKRKGVLSGSCAKHASLPGRSHSSFFLVWPAFIILIAQILWLRTIREVEDPVKQIFLLLLCAESSETL